jgi:hypothetical protein
VKNGYDILILVLKNAKLAIQVARYCLLPTVTGLFLEGKIVIFKKYIFMKKQKNYASNASAT